MIHRVVLEGLVAGESFVVEGAESDVLPAEGEMVELACEVDGLSVEGAFVVDRIGIGTVPTVFVRPLWNL